MKRLVLVAAATALVSGAGLGATAVAAPPSPAKPAGHTSEIRGVIPSRAVHAARPGGSASNLSYHNGPVMRTNVVYTIYMNPAAFPMSSSYSGLISQYFADVAHDSTLPSNVYYSDTQYYDTSGTHIAYSSSVGGTWTDTDPLPASGCTDSYTPNACLSDAQIQAEVQKAMSKNGWSAGANKLFFVFTPKNVGSCAGSQCAFSYYCAYHSWIGSGTSAVLYANMPYADTSPSGCGTGYSPNNNEADDTLNVTSHEHNEAITDPQGNAWYDRRGAENGDKCAWTFGTVTGNYNQTINGHHYILQREWSNASSGCVLQNT